MPTRSAFSGRLPSVPDGDERRFQFFYATNREPSEETFDGRGNRLGNEIATGTFDVLISPYMPIEPFIWFNKNSMKWKSRQALDTAQFREKLSQAVQDSPKKSVLVIVWGFRDWFQSAALKTAYTAYVLDINTPVLLFDWPGNQGEGIRGYQASQVVATKSAADLGKVLLNLAEAGVENIWLMGSSLGCQTICDSFKWLLDNNPSKTKIAHVVLSAPDVATDAFDQKFAQSIQKFSSHLTAYVSSNDRALLMSQWLNRGERLGRREVLTPDKRSTGYEFEEALELLNLDLKHLTVVDATPINTVRNLHHFFTDSPVFFDDLYQRLLRPEEIVSRRLHRVNIAPVNTYWILWND